VMVDDAREITAEQATNYQLTGKKVRGPGASKRSAAAASVRPASLSARPSEASEAPKPPRVFVRLSDSQNQELLLALKRAIDGASGPTDVVLVLGPSDQKQIIKLPVGIMHSEPVLETLRGLVGAENIKVQ
jgi:hypothetical protein